MIFDTDIFIWVQRGNEKAAKLMEMSEDRHLSIQTYMELLQCAKNKNQHKHTKNFLSAFDFIVLPLTENIGHRASIYIEEYTLATGLRSGDAPRRRRHHQHSNRRRLRRSGQGMMNDERHETCYPAGERQPHH